MDIPGDHQADALSNAAAAGKSSMPHAQSCMRIKSTREISDILRQGDYLSAKDALDELIEKQPLSIDGYTARFMRARCHESGFFGVPDLERAESDYRFLMGMPDLVGSRGHLGLARVRFKKLDRTLFPEIRYLCETAIRLDGNVKAMLLLASAHELLMKEHESAFRLYRRAFFKGSKWALKFYSAALVRHHRPFAGFSIGMLAWLVFPVLSMFDRSDFPMA